MIDASRWTRHERGVVLAALASYRSSQHKKSTIAATAKTRAVAGANAHRAASIIAELVRP